ncbi:MAG: class II aldolase/adducin family protein [Xanthobacteraceae bacterium]
MNQNALKARMIEAGKVLVMQGQDDFTRGHISARLPEDPKLFLMKPHSLGLDEITTENILTIDLDGRVVAGNARRHSEVYIHSEILKARPDVQCVLHTHPAYSIALSATGRPLRSFNQGGALFHGSLGHYADTINLIRSVELGTGVARALGGNRAVLLKNHGIVVTAGSIEELVVSALMLEEAARIQLIAEAAGECSPEFPLEDIKQLQRDISQAEQFVVNFDYLVRRLGRGR